MADQSSTEEVFARLSADELAVACALADVPTLPGLRGAVYTTLPDDERPYALEAALRSLVAHSVVHGEDGQPALDETLHALLTVAGEPQLRVAATRTVGQMAEWSHFCLRDEVGVQHRWNLFDVHELEPFAAGEFSSRVTQFVGLDSQGAADLPGFDVTVAALAEALALSLTDQGRRRELLVDSGEPASVDAFLAAVDALVGWGELTLAYRVSSSEFGAVDFTWLDAGELGLWSVPSPGFDPWTDDDTGTLSPEAHSTKVRIEPLSADTVVRGIDEALTEAVGRSASD